MLNKIYFGKRLSFHRRKLGLSQTAMAEILGVTLQAVSKWETGNAIPDVDLLLELSHMFQISINEILEGTDLIFHLTGQKTSSDGIAYFVPEQEQPYNMKWAQEIQNNHWIEYNWKSTQLQNAKNTLMDEIGRRIAACNGIILEIGIGPGGGYMPYVLKESPDAAIIINDLSPTVVREWKSFLDRSFISPQLSYAVFDFCHMPFKNNSIDVVSDSGGIQNCESDKKGKTKALKEAYRVLKPGGMLVSSAGFVNKEDFALLPCEAKKVLMEKRPDIFDDRYEDTILAGFSKIDTVVVDSWYTDDDNSSIADLARTLGVNLKFTRYIRYCTK